MSRKPSSDLFVSVTQGKDSMPAWQARLDQDERWAVIDYIRALTYDPVLQAVAAGGDADEQITFAPAGPQEPQKPDCDASFLTQTNPFDWADGAALAAGEELYSHGPGRDVAGANLCWNARELKGFFINSNNTEQEQPYRWARKGSSPALNSLQQGAFQTIGVRDPQELRSRPRFQSARVRTR